jgi:predicted nuclease of predicted toxin-antitoxin system
VKRLLLDQGLPRSAARFLTEAGWDVIHVGEIGMSRAEDADILDRARTESRVCVTLDADFHSLLATRGERSPSVVRIRKEGLDATGLVLFLQRVWRIVEPALASGAMVTITDRTIRIRALPIVRA